MKDPAYYIGLHWLQILWSLAPIALPVTLFALFTWIACEVVLGIHLDRETKALYGPGWGNQYRPDATPFEAADYDVLKGVKLNKTEKA